MLLRQIYEQELFEAQLSDITIGFEIECIIDGNKKPDFIELAKKYNAEGVDDTSITPTRVFGNEIGIEYRLGALAQGGQMVASPANIVTCANFVHDLFQQGAYTNKSCGMHAHFGLGAITRLSNLETGWITIMMLQSKLFETYATYKGQMLFDNDYASIHAVKGSVQEIVDYATEIAEEEGKDAVIKYLFDNLLSKREFTKYSALFPHGQGTLEWRGLRGVLDAPRQDINYQTVLGFFKLALNFAVTIRQLMNKFQKYTVAGVTLKDIQSYAAKGGYKSAIGGKGKIMDLIKKSDLNKGMQRIFSRALGPRMSSKDYKLQYWDRISNIIEQRLPAATKSLNHIYDMFGQYDLSLHEKMISEYFEIQAKTPINDIDIIIDKDFTTAIDKRIVLQMFFKRCNLIAKDIKFFENHSYLLRKSPQFHRSNKIIVKDEKDKKKIQVYLKEVNRFNLKFNLIKDNIEIDPSKF